MQLPINSNNPEVFASETESYFFDRKSARKDVAEIARHLSAFANALGGKLIIGIEDNGEITGFKRNGAHAIEAFEQAAITTCSPSPDVKCRRISVINSKEEDDLILIMDIAASTDRVVSRRSDKEVFLRQGDKSIKLDHEQVLALEYDKHQRIFEEEVDERSSIDDLDREIVARYKNALGTEVSDEQLLRSRGFLLDGHLTKAGILLFAESPTRFMPCARVRVLKFDGNKMETGRRLNIVKERTFDKCLPRIIEEAKDFIASQLREFQFLGDDGKFKIIPEYPEFAWFEGLVNAVTHRNYAMAGEHIRVSLYDDRMEILSPGSLPNIVTLDNMRTRRYSRNSGIARVLVEMGWVRELNEGVQRIYDEMQASFLHDPVFSEPNEAAVLLTLENSATSRVLRQSDSMAADFGKDRMGALNEYEVAVMQYVYAKGRAQTKTVSELLGRSATIAARTLKSLSDKGFLEWHGTSRNDPSQYYSLKSTE
ncbi:ATP-binding protein [Arabiibacter massiliensis]|uniref:ATP-binding protein n=1 Tax=Arabiibacter massiliensis TaxID=1870985 RepID=UPI0009BB23DD|nr:ATP-binding protein [Arabiibacter massiliensis]